MDEVRPVNIKTREIETDQIAVLLRLPENDQVKSNVRRISIGGLTPAISHIQVDLRILGKICICADSGDKLSGAKERRWMSFCVNL